MEFHNDVLKCLQHNMALDQYDLYDCYHDETKSFLSKLVHQSTKVNFSSIPCEHGRDISSDLVIKYDSTYLYGSHKININIESILEEKNIIHEVITIDDWYEYVNTAHNGQMGDYRRSGYGLKKYDVEKATMFYREICEEFETIHLRFSTVDEFLMDASWCILNSFEQMIGHESDEICVNFEKAFKMRDNY